MKRKTFVQRLVAGILFLHLSFTWLLAQPGGHHNLTVTGSTVDSKTGEPLVGVAVKVTSADGGTGTFGISDADGKFSFEVSRAGTYSLEFSYVGYKTLHREVEIWPFEPKLGKFKLKEDPKLLAEVETIGHSERIKQKGDTLSYNASAYKVQDGATAEALVSKMPGIVVNKEGIKAQGETVQKVLVDGKEFFDNDVKMALRSLPAEVLDRVNIFDKKSDQAEFTGIDDGETVKAMDLITKSYRRNGTFGKVTGGFGNNFDLNNAYWKAGFNLNLFNGNRRITLQGMSNNVNERDFSNEDMGGFGGMMGREWGVRGVARTNGFGINFSDTYLNNEVETELSYFFNQNRIIQTDTTYVDDLNRESSNYAASSSLNHTMSHRIGGRITYRPTERDEVVIRPSLNFQQSDGKTMSEDRSWNHHLSDVSIDRQQQKLWDDVLSRSSNQSDTDNDSWNARANVLWRHRLNKPGRTLSLNLIGGASGSDAESKDIKDQLFGDIRMLENQANTSRNNNSNVGGNIQWVEPLTKELNLSLRYDMNYNQARRRMLYDFYSDDKFSHLECHDSLNTNTYLQRQLRNSGELGLSFNHGTLRANATLRFENSHIFGEQDYFYKHDLYKTSKSYNSILPTLRLEYRTKGGTQFRIDYRSRSQAPSVSNLQESVNTTNRLRYTAGNPDLDQTISHNVHFNMIYTNTETAQNFMIFGGIDATQHQISNQILINRTTGNMHLDQLPTEYGFSSQVYRGLELAPGAMITRPVNRDGHFSAFIDFGYGFPFDAIMSNVNISLGGGYSQNPSSKLYYELDEKGKAGISTFDSRTQTYEFNPSLDITSNISQDLNFGIMYFPQFQWVVDREGNTENQDFINHELDAMLNWTFWNGFTTDQELEWQYFGGPSQPQAISQWVWNASIGKKFLKGNAAEIKLQAFDILGSNKGFSRSVGDSNISTSYRNFMPRYFLCTFTYKITAYKTGGKASTRQTEPESGFPGGGFGGFGPPMF